jgi:hypothetical protein
MSSNETYAIFQVIVYRLLSIFINKISYELTIVYNNILNEYITDDHIMRKFMLFNYTACV